MVSPTLVDVDPTRVEEVRREREVEAAVGPTGLLDDGAASHEVVVTTRWVYEQGTGYEDHPGRLAPAAAARPERGT